MKKLISLIISLLLLTLLVGCGSKEIKDLEIGQTAEFETYSITIKSIESKDNSVFVNVVIKAKDDFTFNPYDLDGYQTIRDQDIHYSTYKNGDIKINAGQTKEVELTYPNADYSYLEWKNKNDLATWIVKEIPVIEVEKDEPEEETKEVINNTANEFQAGAAWGAIEEVGKEEFPYGFEIKWFSGVIAVDPVGENSYFMKAYCEVTNAFGATAKDQVVEATVTGTGENIYNYTVEGFTVY